jgi:uncharacterized protein YacL
MMDIIMPLLITAMFACGGAALGVAFTSTVGADYERQLNRNTAIGAIMGAILFLVTFFISINNLGGLY